MYWATGRTILKAAKLVARHPRLFGAYVTNFSCGPDSFLLTYFRDVMGPKPSLTLELDSHTADAGITTRVEAALDIFRRYTDLERAGHGRRVPSAFRPAEARCEDGRAFVRTAGGEELELADPRVRILFPSMGDLSSEGVAASFRGLGLRAEALPPADGEALRSGLSCSTGKECLPLALTSGSLLRAVEGNGRVPGEVICYFMPTGDGPCRLGQYRVFLKGMVEKREIPDVAIFSLTDNDTYGGLGPEVRKRSWMALAVADVMDDVRNGIRALAVDPEEGLRLFAGEWRRVIASFEEDGGRGIVSVLEGIASRLGALPVREPVEEARHVALVGEIFVRRDVLSKRDLLERLAARGFVVKVAPVTELMYYTDYIWRRGFEGRSASLGDRIGLAVRRLWQRRYEARIKRILAGSGFYRFEMQDLEAVMRAGDTVIDQRLLGEAVVTTGSALHEIVSSACGVVSIGPFGCMPSRIAEAVLTQEMNRKGVARARPDLDPLLEELGVEELPLMTLETDGKAFPQVTEARLEAFALRADRLHRRLRAAGAGRH
jgi:predicted nucleotide-binding protein (sugar kinase/HSP70/actin superfamily)